MLLLRGTTFWKKSLLWYVLRTSSEPTIIWETWGHWQKQKLAYSSTLVVPPSYIKNDFSVCLYISIYHFFFASTHKNTKHET